MHEIQTGLRVLGNGKESKGLAKVCLISTRDAWLKAFKSFAMTILAAISTIVIPGVHFISVPFGILISPIVGFSVFLKSRGKIKGLSGQFPCPYCSASNVMDYQEESPPYYSSCQACKNPLQIYPEMVPPSS